MPPAAIRRRVVVEGRVQGVFFRAACREQAARRGVCGWVRNLADGRVEAVFEGDPSAVRDLVDWCRAGPPPAAVRSVQVVEEPVTGLSGFAVR